MKPVRSLLLTFDYELFLGRRSGTLNRSLIGPTETLRTLLARFGVKAVFFVDTAWLLKLGSHDHESSRKNLVSVREQLVNLARDGHFLFPHIHPHWQEARFVPETGEWDLSDIKHYSFYSLEEKARERLFEESVRILQDILKTAGSQQAINGYRAGGWTIQPFDTFQDLFRKFGIQHDFSVLPGFRYRSGAQTFDFMGAPRKPVYRFSDDILREHPQGEYTEWAISAIRIPGWKNLQNRILMKFLSVEEKRNGDGQSAEGGGIMESAPGLSMVSAELLTAVTLPLYQQYLRQNQFMHFISHPKMISRHNFLNFDRFLGRASEEFKIETDFLKMQIV